MCVYIVRCDTNLQILKTPGVSHNPSECVKHAHDMDPMSTKPLIVDMLHDYAG